MAFDAKQTKRINQASGVLQPGEKIIDVAVGRIQYTRLAANTARSSIIVTDRRIIIYTKKLLGHEMQDYIYDLLTTVEYRKVGIFGELILAASGDRVQISQIARSDIERITRAIRSRIGVANTSGSVVSLGFSSADEIRKFADLRDTGIISDAEFAVKKTQILGL